MNIASFLMPKSMVTYVYDDFSLRQAYEKMTYHGRTEVPVITRENEYVGTLREGDLLRYLTGHMKKSDKNQKTLDVRDFESVFVREILCRATNPPVCINTGYGELIERSITQNFIPVIDDRNSFIGIVTKTSVMKQLALDLKQVQYEKLFGVQTDMNCIKVN